MGKETQLIQNPQAMRRIFFVHNQTVRQKPKSTICLLSLSISPSSVQEDDGVLFLPFASFIQ
jgi:hypothetical protein